MSESQEGSTRSREGREAAARLSEEMPLDAPPRPWQRN